jgi:hypothetical protein
MEAAAGRGKGMTGSHMLRDPVSPFFDRQFTPVPGPLENAFKLMAGNLKTDAAAAEIIRHCPLVKIIDQQPLRGGPVLSFQGKTYTFDRSFNFLKLFLEQVEEVLFVLRGIPFRKGDPVRSLHMNDRSSAFILKDVGAQREMNSAKIDHDAFSSKGKNRFHCLSIWCLWLKAAIEHSYPAQLQSPTRRIALAVPAHLGLLDVTTASNLIERLKAWRRRLESARG